jgi:hypothetical protein
MTKSVPAISVSYARNGNSTKANAFGMRPMQERAYERRGVLLKGNAISTNPSHDTAFFAGMPAKKLSASFPAASRSMKLCQCVRQ